MLWETRWALRRRAFRSRISIDGKQYIAVMAGLAGVVRGRLLWRWRRISSSRRMGRNFIFLLCRKGAG